MKKISVVIPCYNEEENVRPMAEAVCGLMERELPAYDYELLFIDNCSQDRTRSILRELCAAHPKVKAILNAKNFGQFNSPYHALCEAGGDCAIFMCCDFQDPVELLVRFVDEWERGAAIVCGIKTASRENKLMRFFRTCYYKLIRAMSETEQIEHFTGFGLYDRSFLNVLRELDDPTPFLRGIVAELGFRRVDIPYEQQRRRAGKTHNNFPLLYDAAMLSFTSYTKAIPRLAGLVGGALSALSLLASLVCLILWLAGRPLPQGTAVFLAVAVFGSLNLFATGMVGEYVMSMNRRSMHRPLVVEETRLGFDREEGTKEETDA